MKKKTDINSAGRLYEKHCVLWRNVHDGKKKSAETFWRVIEMQANQVIKI